MNFGNFDISTHFPEDILIIEKYRESTIIMALYFYGIKKQFYIKRFLPELKSKKIYFIDQGKESYLELVSSSKNINLELQFVKPRNKDARPNEHINPIDFISLKGIYAIGNQLSRHAIKTISMMENQKHEKELFSDKKDNDNQITINF